MSFAISQYFAFERQWVALFIKYINQYPDIFTSSKKEEAQYIFGIGVRKIESLVDWVIKLKIAKKKEGNFYLTNFGELLSKYDKTIEEKSTWYLFHYNLSSSRDNLEVYYWLFNHYDKYKFTLLDIKKDLRNYKSNLSERTISNAVGSVLDLFKNTPIGTELEILEPRKDFYYKNELNKTNLDFNILSYILLDWAINNNRSTANLEELYYPGAPAKVLSIRRKLLLEYLDSIKMAHGKNILWISRTANLNSISFNLKINPFEILEKYYSERYKK